MEQIKYTVSDERGLHARNAMSLCKLAESFVSEIVIRANDREANCKNMMSLMNLQVRQRDTVEITITGEDEATAAGVIKATLFNIL